MNFGQPGRAFSLHGPLLLRLVDATELAKAWLQSITHALCLKASRAEILLSSPMLRGPGIWVTPLFYRGRCTVSCHIALPRDPGGRPTPGQTGFLVRSEARGIPSWATTSTGSAGTSSPPSPSTTPTWPRRWSCCGATALPCPRRPGAGDGAGGGGGGGGGGGEGRGDAAGLIGSLTLRYGCGSETCTKMAPR